MAKNLDFNFEEFAVSAIKAIDEIRSYGKDGATTPIEPRINAFYRAVGLPAAVSVESTQQSLNSGNLFSPNTLRYETHTSSFSVRKFAFKREITQEEIDQFLLFNQNKFSDSIKSITEARYRARGVLFPLIVDGEIPIFPQEKRVADAFQTDEQLLVGTTKYRRPLIEAIILMRLKSEGVQNQEIQNKISQDFGAETLQDISQFAPLISTALVNTTDGLTDLLAETVKKANRAKKETGTSLTPVIANIAQQSLARNEVPEKMIGKVDKAKRSQEERVKTQQAILAALEYDDSFTGDIKESRNVKDAMLTSNLLSVINSSISNQSKIKKDIKDTERKKEKAVTDIRAVFRTLDLLLGTFGAISGVDILVVMVALFKININALLGLLNDNAIENLKKIKGENIASSKLSLSNALDALQNEVVNLFNQIESNSMQTKHARKRSRQEEGGV